MLKKTWWMTLQVGWLEHKQHCVPKHKLISLSYSFHNLRQSFKCMPLPWVYSFDLVFVSVALWLNFTVPGCKKRNVRHEEKFFLHNQKNWGVRK